MEIQEALSYIPEDFFVPDFTHVQSIRDKDKKDLDIIGNDEIGYYKEITENNYVLVGEKSDTVVHVLNQPEIYALKIVHYHKRGDVYTMEVFL